MPRYTATVTYETTSGGCSWATLDLDAPSLREAGVFAGAKISADRRRKVRCIRTTNVRLIDQPRQFEQARFVQHGQNQQQLPKGQADVTVTVTDLRV